MTVRNHLTSIIDKPSIHHLLSHSKKKKKLDDLITVTSLSLLLLKNTAKPRNNYYTPPFCSNRHNDPIGSISPFPSTDVCNDHSCTQTTEDCQQGTPTTDEITAKILKKYSLIKTHKRGDWEEWDV